jgi:glycerol-3-phosphate dehydrogenase (NAD(P)+)
MPERISILGAGSWGMAIARLLDLNGHAVTLWAYDPGEYRQLTESRSIPERLKGLTLAPSIAISADLESAVQHSNLLVLAVPSQFLRSVLASLPRTVLERREMVNLAKGIETGSLKRMSEMIPEVTGADPGSIVTLSGPSHAEEVILDMPTTVVVAGPSDALAGRVQGLFSSSSFRVYTSRDVVGVELGGSLKNIIALAAGIVDGLGFGDNTKGALITRGLAEMTRLGLAMGAMAETFAGLSGIGDLVATCTSKHSRNRNVGERIGRGEKLEQILSSMSMVAEGVETTRSGFELAKRSRVEMPITTEVHRVLFEGKPPAEAVANLMGRSLKAEIWQ